MNSSSPRAWAIFPFLWVSCSFLYRCFIASACKSSTSLVRVIPKYFLCNFKRVFFPYFFFLYFVVSVQNARYLSGEESACQCRDMVSIPGSGRSPGKWNATHAGILAWEIAWTEEPGGLQSMGSQKNQKTTYRLNHNCSSVFCLGHLAHWHLR